MSEEASLLGIDMSERYPVVKKGARMCRGMHASVKKLGLGLLLMYAGSIAYGHPEASLYGEIPLGWSTDQIGEVIGDWGVGDKSEAIPRVVVVEGKRCLIGKEFDFKVRDEFGFDIDESVGLDVEFGLGADAADVAVTYDHSGGAPVTKGFQLPAASAKGAGQKETVILERARFAGLGPHG